MIPVHVRRKVAITATKLWPVLGSFSRLPEWFPGITAFECEGDGVGQQRFMTIGPFKIIQQLLKQDNSAYQTLYQVTEGPGISKATGFVVTLSLDEITDTNCTIDWKAVLDQLPDIMPAGSEAAFIARTEKSYSESLDYLERQLAHLKTV